MVAHPDIETVWQWLDEVPDPEIPVISLVDLGIVRDVAYSGNVLNVTLSPTYSGCPATRVIEQDVRNALGAHGVDQLVINQQISPPWTTDWMSEKGKMKLREYGIAPPSAKNCSKHLEHFENAPNLVDHHKYSTWTRANATRCERAL